MTIYIDGRAELTDELHESYRKKAKEYAKSWKVMNPHVIHLMLSIMLDRDGLMDGGSFVKAVNRNDLQDAVMRADAISMSHLKILVATKNNCHVVHKFL
jgi:hypothetical protein